MAVKVSPEEAGKELATVLVGLVNRIAAQSARQKILAHRRGQERHALEVALPACLRPLDEPFLHEFRVWAQDISHSGVGLITDRELQKDLVFRLSFYPLGLSDMPVPVRVVNCSELVGSVRRVGAIFVTEAVVPQPPKPRR